MSDPSVTYRDATYSAETQEQLRLLMESLDLGDYVTKSERAALRDVIARWDANDATETIIEEAHA